MMEGRCKRYESWCDSSHCGGYKKEKEEECHLTGDQLS